MGAITLSGTVQVDTPPTSPVFTADPTSLSGFTYTQSNGPSASQSFNASGSNLDGSSVAANATGDFEISSDNISFGTTVTIGTATSFTNTPIYVRLKSGLTANSYAGSVVISGGGATDKTVPLTGSVTPPPPANDLCGNPTVLIVNAAATGGNLTNSTITAPFSTAADDGFNDVWYRFTPANTGEHVITLAGFTGDADLFLYATQCPSDPSDILASSIFDSPEVITETLTSGITYYVRVSAYNVAASTSAFTIRVTAPEPCVEPSAQPTNLSFGAITYSAIPGSFTATAADGYLVVRSTAATLSADPADGVSYTAGTPLGGGTVVQASSSTSFTANGLSSATPYYFFVFAYNNLSCSGAPNYRTAGALQGSASTISGPFEDFEGNTWSGYTTGTVTFNSGIWEFQDVAAGNGGTDRKNGVRSARIRDGFIQTNFDIPNGLGSVTINHANFGSDTGGEWQLSVSNDGGSTWNAYISPTQVCTATLSPVTLNVNVSGNVRMRITKTAGNRINIDDIYITSNIVTWNGSAWTNGTPAINKDVVIAGAKTVAPADSFSARSLTVNSGASIAIQSGATVTVNGAIVNNAGENNFTVASNGNLMQDENATANTNTGSISISRSTDIRLYDYVYWSSPVDGQKVRAFSPLTVESRFYLLYEENNAYRSLFLPATAGMGYDPLAYEFVPAKGYMVRAPGNYTTSLQTFTGTFKGVPHNGSYSIQATNGAGANAEGYNIIGNPYPSPVDATEFVDGNPGIGTLYFWTHNDQVSGSSNYASWNRTGPVASAPAGVTPPNGTIQVGQGFVVQVAATMTVNFTNAMRTDDHNNQFYRNANTDNGGGRLWLDLHKNGVAMHQTLIGYVDGATDGNDLPFDGKLFNEGKSSLYSVIEGGAYVIQGKSLPFADTDVVPLGFTATEAATYTISLGNTDGLFAGDQDIFLKDNSTGSLHDLKDGAYEFASEAGIFTNRFEVVYMNALGTELPVNAAGQVVVYTTDNLLHVHSGSLELADVKVFDIRGRLITAKQAAGTSATLSFTAEKQVLIVQVTTKTHGTVTRKVVF